MRETVSALYGDEGQDLQLLRAEDPEASLKERWRRLLQLQPDVASKYSFLPMMMRYGWAVVAEPEDAVAYTVGLHYRFGQRELLLHAPELELEEQTERLNELAQLARRGQRFEPGTRVTYDDGTTLTFQAYEDATFEQYPCGYLARFESLFEDREHEAGGTLPILWAKLEGSGGGKAAKKPPAKKVAAKRPPAKKSVAKKKPAAKRPPAKAKPAKKRR